MGGISWCLRAGRICFGSSFGGKKEKEKVIVLESYYHYFRCCQYCFCWYHYHHLPLALILGVVMEGAVCRGELGFSKLQIPGPVSEFPYLE